MMSIFTSLLSVILEVLASAIRQEKEKCFYIDKKGAKLFLFADNMMIDR
jgi:hypothetical protein